MTHDKTLTVYLMGNPDTRLYLMHWLNDIQMNYPKRINDGNISDTHFIVCDYATLPNGKTGFELRIERLGVITIKYVLNTMFAVCAKLTRYVQDYFLEPDEMNDENARLNACQSDFDAVLDELATPHFPMRASTHENDKKQEKSLENMIEQSKQYVAGLSSHDMEEMLQEQRLSYSETLRKSSIQKKLHIVHHEKAIQSIGWPMMHAATYNLSKNDYGSGVGNSPAGWNNQLLTAMIDNKPVGILSFELGDDRIVWITSGYVDKNHRRQGVYTALWQSLITFAKQEQVLRIASSVTINNIEMQEVCKKQGRVATSINYRYEIGDVPPKTIFNADGTTQFNTKEQNKTQHNRIKDDPCIASSIND